MWTRKEFDGRKFEKPSHDDWRDMLADVVAFLNDENISYDDRMFLWNILSALRGPDEDRHGDMDARQVKNITTAVIRHIIGINPATIGADVYEDCESSRERRVKWMEDCHQESRHFATHIRAAFRAINADPKAVVTRKGQ